MENQGLLSQGSQIKDSNASKLNQGSLSFGIREVSCSIQLAADYTVQNGYCLSGVSFYPKDKRDDNSVYAGIFSGQANRNLLLRQVYGNIFKLVMAQDLKGWYLTVEDRYANDQRSEYSQRVNIHQKVLPYQEWRLEYLSHNLFKIYLKDSFSNDSTDWLLTASNNLQIDKRDDNSAFIHVSANPNEGNNVWRIDAN